LGRVRPSTIYLLHQTSQALRSRLEHALRGLGVTGIQYTILALVERHAGLSSADLSRRFFVTPQTMNQIVAGMTQRGLLTRAASDANKRILEMTLTEEGRALLARCEDVADKVEQEALAPVPAERLGEMRGHLSALLRQLRDTQAGPQTPVEELRAGAPARSNRGKDRP
jgi:DNA-binding MarR family transcriptional regulator